MALDDEEVLRLLDAALGAFGSRREEGESYREPPLDVLAYYRRPVALGRIPVVGRASGVLAVVRPTGGSASGTGWGEAAARGLIGGVSRVIQGRYPPLRRGAGLTVGLAILALADGGVQPEAEAGLQAALARVGRSRVVTLGVILLDPVAASMAFALREGPGGLFPEGRAAVEALEPHCRRYLPLWDGGDL